MKFWEGNRADGEFELEPAEVARIFATGMRRLAKSPEDPAGKSWQAKLDSWPLERVLRDWMTSPAGLNAVWEDEEGFASVLREAGAMMEGIH